MKLICSLFFSLFLVFGAFGQQNVGTTADGFNGTSLDGKDISLDNYQGSIVVLNFWSTKCAICHEEIPKLNKLTDKYSGKDVVFVGLTMENETNVNLYLRKRPFKFTIVPNSLGVLLKYADRDNRGNPNMGFPAYFIINELGELTYKSSGWDKTSKIDSEINKLLITAENRKNSQNKSKETN